MNNNWTALARVDYMLGKGHEATNHAHPKGSTITEVAQSLALMFPMRGQEVRVDQHNGGGLDVRAGISAPAATPTEYGHHVRFEAYIMRADYKTPTDADWAELIEALVSLGAEVVAPRAPSSHLWSQGITGHGRQATPADRDAQERASAAMKA